MISRRSLVSVACALLYFSSSAAARSFQAKFLHGWKRAAAADAHAPVYITFAIKQSNEDRVNQLFWEVSNPNSTSYGNYLTFEEVGELTRNAAATEAVHKFLLEKAAPLMGGDVQIQTSVHGSFVETVLSAGVADKLLSTEFATYLHPQFQHAVLKTHKFEIPAELEDHVTGLPHIAYFPRQTRPSIVSEASDAESVTYVTPKILFDYYGISHPFVSNAKSTQSVFESLGQNFDNTDLLTFQNKFGLKAANVSSVIGPNNPSDCFSSKGGEDCGEANLDVQYIMAIAQGAPTTYWSIASSNDPFLDWVKALSNVASPPLVHSISYGGYESESSDVNTFNLEVQKLGLRGVTVIVSSGDDGVSNFQARGHQENCGYYPSFPATSPFVTAVGATQGPEAGAKEIVCSAKTGGGITTGGGFSAIFDAPQYQKNDIAHYFSVASPKPVSGFSAQGRGIPDVAVMGRNYVIEIGNKALLVSGTSASAPVFAGMITLANDCRLSAGKKPLGFLNQVLYSLAAKDSNLFNDITEGDNTCTASAVCCDQGFYAAAGWDPITGLGTPRFSKLLTALCEL